jgi:putative sigma-54 modulation protein
MRLHFTGRKALLTSALRDFAATKLEKLEKVLGEVLDAHVVLTREKHRQGAEIVVKARTKTLTAKAEAAEFTDAVAACADRLLTQARRHTDRRNSRRKGRGPWETPRRRAADLAAPDVAPADGIPEIVRMGRMAVRPMSVREALLRARDSQRPVLVFRDLASQQVAVIIRRPDGQYGLVETEA